MIIPKGVSLTICFNEHKNFYETPEEYYKDYRNQDIDKETFDKCKAKDAFWSLQYYVHPPIGFYKIFSDNLERLLEMIPKLEEEAGL